MKEVTKYDYNTGEIKTVLVNGKHWTENPMPNYQPSEVHWNISPSPSVSVSVSTSTNATDGAGYFVPYAFINTTWERYSDLINWDLLHGEDKPKEDSGKEFWD